MNIQLRPPGLSYVTQAAEGLQRRLWTVAEIEAMVVAGIIDDGERFELIDGDVVPKHARSLQHEVIRGSLVAWWMKGREARFHIACMSPFRLNASSFLEPDFVFFASKTKLADLKPSNALLAVEGKNWRKEMDSVEAYLQEFGTHLPRELLEEHRRVVRALA